MKQVVELQIELETHIPWAVKLVTRLAQNIGFSDDNLSDIGVCIRELASNALVQSSSGGWLKAEEIERKGERGVEISFHSNGSFSGSDHIYEASIRSVAAAQCFADEFHVYSSRKGQQIQLRKYVLPRLHPYDVITERELSEYESDCLACDKGLV